MAYQDRLTALGLYDGKIDGLIGPKSIEAIKQFQALRGHQQTGNLTAAQGRQLIGQIVPDRQVTPPTIAFPHDDPVSMTGYYGRPGENIIQVEVAYRLELAWKPGTFTDHISVNKRCATAFQEMFRRILEMYGYEHIRELHLDQYGGGFNNRPITGGTRPSTHAYGAAIDLDPAHNQLTWDHRKAAFAKPDYVPLMNIVYDLGLTSLGKRKNYDYMHFQAAWVR